jgi:hypothetical protein
MLKSWMIILPLFIIRILARKCEVITIRSTEYYNPFKGILIRKKRIKEI